ncbi:hypothetical protein LTY37_04415 [Limosilactobacillus agrestis]|uniref:hypothetical protein n=1 Tax=Limosilactobacillus agrestis TaxID=2759748 RepID=UPI001E3C0460|nr:hypothetical protein [Limosilactobacillus agrestis]MCD7120047.1 hypothetical protein [Limosilactobacillus agrestis]
MAILDNFKEKKISFSLTYFGKNDFDTPHTIKVLIDNYTYFKNLVGRHLDKISSIDDYILWLINNKILNLKECIPLIIGDDNQKLIGNLIIIIEEKQKNLTGDIIKFINHNISEIFEYDNFDFHEATLNFIKKYQNGIKNSTFETLFEKKRFYFLYNFNDFNRVFKKNIDLLEKLIYTEKFLTLNNTNIIKQIIGICLIIGNYQDENFVALSERVIADIYRKYLILVESDQNENQIFELRDIGKALLNFFKNKKDSRANKIENINKMLDRDISNYVMKHGVEVKQTIPVEKILKNWIGLSNPILRMLSLTHKSEKGTTKSNLSVKDIPNSLMDIFTSNIPTDAYYTLIRQQTIESIASIGSALFIGILQKEEYYTTYFTDFFSLLSLVIKELNFDDDILEEGRMLILNINMLIKNILERKNPQIILQKTLDYNIEMLCCALIESLLREYYRIRNEQIMYINYSNLTLGSLLNPTLNNSELFSKDHLLTLAFFLISSGENKDIGHNYRNNLAHLLHVYKNTLSLSTVCLLMYLLTDVLNTIYVGLMKHK